MWDYNRQRTDKILHHHSRKITGVFLTKLHRVGDLVLIYRLTVTHMTLLHTVLNHKRIDKYLGHGVLIPSVCHCILTHSLFKTLFKLVNVV